MAVLWPHTKTLETSDIHLKPKIANRKLFIPAQDEFYDLPMIYHYLLSSKAPK